MKRQGPARRVPLQFASRRARRESAHHALRSGALAVRAARTLGLNVCGVDMLRSKSGPLVLEVNSSPGIEGLEKATGSRRGRAR